MSDFSLEMEELREDEFLYGDKKDSMKTKTGDKFTNSVKIIFFVLIGFAILEFVFYKFIRPSTGIPKVSVSGSISFSPDEIVDLLRPMNASNWFDFDVNTAVSVIASIPAIDAVAVRKFFTDKIYIDIKERQGVAMTFLNADGYSVAVQIDENGVLFPKRQETAPVSLPIVSGLPVEHLTEGMRIPLKYRALMSQISEISKMSQKYFAAISEICVIPKEYGNYELALIPAASKIRVLTDRALNEDALKDMIVALDVVNLIEPDVFEIDLRYGSVSYRKH